MKIFLLIILQLANFINCNSLKIIKQRPIFSDATISAATQVIIPRNISLATGFFLISLLLMNCLIIYIIFQVILVVEATTYKEAQPIVYSILENIEYFRINPVTGYVYIYSPLINQV